MLIDIDDHLQASAVAGARDADQPAEQTKLASAKGADQMRT